MTDATGTKLRSSLLRVALHGRLSAPDAEAGVERLQTLTEVEASPLSWHAAIATALHDGLIHDPVRLSPGALQCHWVLEITPLGLAELSNNPSSPSAGLA